VRRAVDILVASLGLLAVAPVLLVAGVAVWLQDRGSPLYISYRIGRDGVPFRLVKLRSMVAEASHAGVDTTTAFDRRVTRVGRVIRRLKLDEFPQLWNVLAGHMSLVGPRPNVPREVDRYTMTEREQLSLRPGLTDLSSIVFSNLGQILAESHDPNRDYALGIRPWKSRLALLYVRKRSLRLDLEVLGLTLACLISRPIALRGVEAILTRLDAPGEVRQTVRDLREGVGPAPFPPPGVESEPTLPAGLHKGI
jgi:lipopolysaccharide/colanic/teichoic acid biosynthesis glycosyltransferase